jgi:hypothetical protein
LRLLTRPEELDYALLYPSTVLQDHGDMHLDLRPDHTALPHLVRVPLRLFLPGAYVKVRPGGRVRLDDEASLTLIEDPALVRVDAPRVELAGSGPPVARVGDPVQVGSAVGTIISGSSKVFAG